MVQELAILLRRLKSGGHKALIFTQMARMLDILEVRSISWTCSCSYCTTIFIKLYVKLPCLCGLLVMRLMSMSS